MNITGAIFDLDGTLLDSMGIWGTIAEDYLRHRHIEPHEDLNETFRTMSLYQSACYYQRHYHIKDSSEKIISDINKMVQYYYVNEAKPKTGVYRFLEKLKCKNVKMVVATAIDRNIAKAALERCDILNFFQDIITCQEVGSGKDEPHIYNKALNTLNTSRLSTWVFEDAVHAVQTAKLAGFPVVGVYDKSVENWELICKVADIHIKSFEEMG